VRDPSHRRLLTDAELRELFAANRLELLRERSADERRELSAYLDLAGCEAERRTRAESLAAAEPRLLVERIGWYLLARR
jgi:hypothetical protein